MLNTFVGRWGTCIAITATLVVGTTPARTAAQERTERTDSLEARLTHLLAVVDSLRAEVGKLSGEGQETEAEDALAKLRAAALAAASAGGEAPPSPEDAPSEPSVGRQRSLQALNPEISLTGDVFSQVVEGDVGKENFFAREFELSIISNLDPFSRAKAFISRHVPGGEITPFEGSDAHEEEEAGFSVEEGYVEWVGLPGSLGLKLGRFYQQLGQLNRWHGHALPFQSRSLPSLAFIGEEPLGQTGASIRWLVPFGGDAGTYTVTVETTRSENDLLFGSSSRLSVLSNLNAFWELSRATDLDLSVSWLNGSYEDETNLFDRTLVDAELSFTWRPPEAARYRGLNVRAGVMVLDGLVSRDGVALDDRATGFWSMAELRLSQSWLAGGRFDWVENPRDVTESAWLVSPTLTWWQSEFVRLRAEYDLLGRGAVDEGRLLFQVTFAMGPHKHETY